MTNHSAHELVPRDTVELIVGYHDKALELYARAYDLLEVADAAVKAAHEMAGRAHPGINGFNYDRAKEVEAFHNAIKLPPRDRYLRTAAKLLNCDTWSYIVQQTDLERLMDKEAKDKLHDQLRYVPDKVDRDGQLITEDEAEKGMPPLTVENVYATLETFQRDAGFIMARGVANAFANLDRRFRSHDGFKIKHRIILTYAFDSHGFRYNSRQQDTLLDVERVFLVLDNKKVAAYGGIVHQCRQEAGWGSPRPIVIEGAYFRIRIFGNGNAHLWFTRRDLVEKVNKILADWYGEVIADGQTRKEDPLNAFKSTPAKYYGFYPTPDVVADQLLDGISFYVPEGAPPMRVLEPSAGRGALALRCAKARTFEDRRHAHQTWTWMHKPRVDCVEIQPHHAQALEDMGAFNRVFCGDFLQLTPERTGLYDLIVMNPPFDLERDIDHVMHALKFLQPQGELHAIMSAGTEFRETRKSEAFRAMMTKMNASWSDLPAGSFSSVGTNVNTLILRVSKNGAKRYWRY